MRVLYFDIDGTLTRYDDAPKAALVTGRLERTLRALSFDRLHCVSGWVDLAANPATRFPERERARKLYDDLLAPFFPDREWFLARVTLTADPDHRCRDIDLEDDWWYADDWADAFFVEQFRRELYDRELGRRVLRVDPFGDGTDLLDWLGRVPRDPQHVKTASA